MLNSTRVFRLALAGALTLAALVRSAEPGPNQPLADALKEVLNRGATLYNNGDRNGAYRLFEGALLALRPQFGGRGELQQFVDAALKDAEQHPAVGERAWALRTALIDVRNKLAIDGAKAAEMTKPAESKPAAAPKAPTAKSNAVTGKVTLDGQPLAAAFIRLTSEEGPGKGYTAKTNADGSFDIKEVKPGKYKVSFTTTDPTVKLPARYRNSATTELLIEVAEGTGAAPDFNLINTPDEKK